MLISGASKHISPVIPDFFYLKSKNFFKVIFGKSQLKSLDV